MDRVVVTGANGFIGRHLCPRLRAAGYEVVEANSTLGDVAEPQTWSRIPSAEVVVHLAGLTFVPSSWRDPVGCMRVNLLGTMRALSFCQAHRARLVYLSSYLYGNPRTQPVSEDAPLSANSPYGLSKLMAEETCRFYATHFLVPVAIFRPFNVYGPGQGDDFLIPHIIRQIRVGKEVRVKDLRPKRDYVYVGDVVDAIIRSVDLKEACGVFNLGTGRSHSVGELIEITQRAAGTNLPVSSSEETRPNEIMDAVANIARSRAILGWEPRWDLKAGIGALLAGSGQTKA